MIFSFSTISKERENRLQRKWHAVWLLLALGSQSPAAAMHRALPKRPLVAASIALRSFDHVPVAAERIAAAFGTVTSTFRTVAHNRQVGGVPDSYHLQGRAIDIARRPGITHAQIAAALRIAGFVLIESLDEGDHSHFAFGGAVAGKTRPDPKPAPSPAIVQTPAPTLPHVAADEHGALLSDGPNENIREAAAGPTLNASKGSR